MILRPIRRFWKRHLTRPVWHDLRSTTPLSRTFGLDRGTPVDRYYIQQFLEQQKSVITGSVLEIGDDTYTKRYGHEVRRSDVLHVRPAPGGRVIAGDLTMRETLPGAVYDCCICTQTLNFIYDVREAVKGVHSLLRPGGTVLATVAGLCQISRYDMERWGDYWRFTTASARRMFDEVFDEGASTVISYGNVLSAVAFLEGLASDELNPEELDRRDDDYQVVICIAARRTHEVD